MEKWKDIEGYEGYYQVSNRGRVRSVDRIVRHSKGGPYKLKGRILRPRPVDKYGHVQVFLCKNGLQRSAYIHRLVLAAFVCPCPAGKECLHGAAGISDNSIGNLKWGSRSENQLDKNRRDRTGNGVPVVCSDGRKFINISVAAEKTGCDASNICKCCRGIYKTTGGYSWRYKHSFPAIRNNILTITP